MKLFLWPCITLSRVPTFSLFFFSFFLANLPVYKFLNVLVNDTVSALVGAAGMSAVEEKLDETKPSTRNNDELVGEDDGEEDLSWSSDSEIGDALDWLDAKEDAEAVDGAFSLNARRPNAHGGLYSRHNSSTLQPLANRNQKFTNHIRASPLAVYYTYFLIFYGWLYLLLC